MGRYQCHKCNREFARSDCLRRHLSSGVCKDDQKDMSDSDEERVMSVKTSYGPGEDIFENTDNSTDEDEEEDEEEDDEEVEEDIPRVKKKHYIQQWDVLGNIEAENFNEIVAGTVSK